MSDLSIHNDSTAPTTQAAPQPMAIEWDSESLRQLAEKVVALLRDELRRERERYGRGPRRAPAGR